MRWDSIQVTKKDLEKSLVGRKSALYYLPHKNKKYGVQIDSDDCLWTYVDSLRHNVPEKETGSNLFIQLHMSMGKKKRSDDDWGPVPENFDPLNASCIRSLSIDVLDYLSPELVQSSKDKRESKRGSLLVHSEAGNKTKKIDEWLKAMLSSESSILYHSMTLEQYKIAKDYLFSNSYNGIPVYEKFPMDDPQMLPQNISLLLGGTDKALALFQKTGLPSKNSNDLDANGYPLVKQMKRNEPTIPKPVEDFFNNLNSGNINMHMGGNMIAQPSHPSSSSMKYKVNFERMRDEKTKIFSFQISMNEEL